MAAVLISVAVNGLVIGLLYFLLRKRINRILGGGEVIDEIKDEINRLVVELNQTADRNIGIIEERIARLKRLVEEADKKITLLGRESEKVRIGTEVYDRLKRSKSLVSKDGLKVTDTTDVGSVPPDHTPDEERIAEKTGQPAVDDAAGTGPRAGGRAAARVLELYRQGFEPKIIASQTGSTLGEIELIISLAGGGKLE